MSIVAPLLGVWRLQSLTSGGREVITGQTHLVVQDDRLWEVWRDTLYYEGEPGPERRYSVAVDGPVLRLTVHEEDRPERCGLVRVTADEMQIRWGPAGNFARSFDDDDGRLQTLVRETGGAADALTQPPLRRVRVTRSHPLLGALRRNDNLGWWEAHVAFGDVDRVRLRVDGPPDIDDADLDRAAAILTRVPAGLLRAFAAARLLVLHNDTWRQEDPPIDAPSFAARLTPESFEIDEDGAVSVYFDDGDLFGGHVVIVSLDPDLEPRDAQIAG